jgi:opacity protein-like surface antigen
MSRAKLVLALASLLLAAGAAPAWADPAAAQHQKEGRAFYAEGRYAEALAAFEAAYAASHEPRYLVDIAHAQRRLGNHDQALARYRAYLEAEPRSTSRADVEAWIADTEAERSALVATPPPVAEGAPQGMALSAGYYGPGPAGPPFRLLRERQLLEKRRRQAIGATVAGIVLGVVGVGLFAGGLFLPEDPFGRIGPRSAVLGLGAVSAVAALPCLIAGGVVWGRTDRRLQALKDELAIVSPQVPPTPGASLAWRF